MEAAVFIAIFGVVGLVLIAALSVVYRGGRGSRRPSGDDAGFWISGSRAIPLIRIHPISREKVRPTTIHITVITTEAETREVLITLAMVILIPAARTRAARITVDLTGEGITAGLTAAAVIIDVGLSQEDKVSKLKNRGSGFELKRSYGVWGEMDSSIFIALNLHGLKKDA